MRSTTPLSDTTTTPIYTLSLHDALPIWPSAARSATSPSAGLLAAATAATRASPGSSRAQSSHAMERQDGSANRISAPPATWARSEEHTSELQSRENLVCRLLLEKKNDTK